MAVPTYAAARQQHETVLASWTACRVAWPDQDFTPPEPSDALSAPQSYLAVEDRILDEEFITFTREARVDGQVVIDVWVEKRAGDALVRTHAENLRVLFRAGSVEGLTYLEPVLGPAQSAGQPLAWYGRRLSIPYVWTR